MKKLIIISLVLCCSSSYAQVSNLRHIKGQNGGYINYSYNELSNSYEGGYLHYFSKRFFLKAGVSYEEGNINEMKFHNYFVELEGNTTIISLFNVLYINPCYGIFAGIETANNEIIDDDYFSIVPGIMLGGNIEVFLMKNLAIEFGGDQRMNFNSQMGYFTYRLNVGIKIIY